MRLKISFEDIKILFNYLDKGGKGEISYDEFSFLLEERWRGIDPIETTKLNLKLKKNPMETSEPESIDIY